MQEKHYVKYLSDDGFEFDSASDAITRDSANELNNVIEQYTKLKTALFESCDHNVVRIEAYMGDFDYYFHIQCECCRTSFRMPQSDWYWKGRYDDMVGGYSVITKT